MFIDIFAITEVQLILNDCNVCSSVKVTKPQQKLGFFYGYIPIFLLHFHYYCQFKKKKVKKQIRFLFQMIDP